MILSANIPKFRYYSAHDSTLNALLAAFDMINDNNHSWPPFAADILIELWKNGQNEDDYAVKIYYCQKVNINVDKEYIF